jgi:hypothetical protein
MPIVLERILRTPSNKRERDKKKEKYNYIISYHILASIRIQTIQIKRDEDINFEKKRMRMIKRTGDKKMSCVDHNTFQLIANL